MCSFAVVTKAMGSGVLLVSMAAAWMHTATSLHQTPQATHPSLFCDRKVPMVHHSH